MTSPDQQPPYLGYLRCMSCQVGRTPIEAYVGIKQAYLGSLGESWLAGHTRLLQVQTYIRCKGHLSPQFSQFPAILLNFHPHSMPKFGRKKVFFPLWPGNTQPGYYIGKKRVAVRDFAGRYQGWLNKGGWVAVNFLYQGSPGTNLHMMSWVLICLWPQNKNVYYSVPQNFVVFALFHCSTKLRTMLIPRF
jgi:hypothetical protein